MDSCSECFLPELKRFEAFFKTYRNARTVDFLKVRLVEAIFRKNVHATIPRGNMGYVQYTVPDTVAVEPTFVAFL